MIILSACASGVGAPVTIIDGNNIIHIESNQKIPQALFNAAGVSPGEGDRALVNGMSAPMDQPITASPPIYLQLKRAVPITIILPEGQQATQTSAFTVGDALDEAGIRPSTNDDVNPPMGTPITDSMQITYHPARDVTITSGAEVITIRSAAGTVGEALAEAGIPLMGLDSSSPPENEPLPTDGQIMVTRVTESISVAIESIPFDVEKIISADVQFGQEKIITPGENGASMLRTRIRYENGVETSRILEDSTTLRDPVKQVVASGSKIVLAPVGGNIPYEYWYATKIYATVYSPCTSGPNGCLYGTASGAKAGYGIIGVDYSIYSYLAGMKVYIPGYGLGTIGDTGGGPIVESALGVPRTQWMDLGFDDGNIFMNSGWVTVYFLAPAPAEIPYFFK